MLVHVQVSAGNIYLSFANLFLLFLPQLAVKFSVKFSKRGSWTRCPKLACFFFILLSNFISQGKGCFTVFVHSVRWLWVISIYGVVEGDWNNKTVRSFHMLRGLFHHIYTMGKMWNSLYFHFVWLQDLHLLIEVTYIRKKSKKDGIKRYKQPLTTTYSATFLE